MKTHLQDVQMVWVGGDLLYANKATLDKVKPGQCEAMLLYGYQKQVCVKNTKPSAPQGRTSPRRDPDHSAYDAHYSRH